MKETVTVPEDRVGVIKSKKTREDIRKQLDVTIAVFENTAEIDGEDGLKVYTAKNIIKAIARGFSPVRAMRLCDENSELEILELSKFSDKKIETIRSRVIGTNGKTRNYIEDSSKCYISVYGKTICLIGTREQIEVAKEAIEMLIEGNMHKSVYSFLDKARIK